MAETARTWAQLESDIADTMRKWRVWVYTIESPFAKLKAVERRQATKAGQTVEQRNVALRFEWRSPGTFRQRTITLTANSADTAQENLERLAKAIEQVRLAEVRNGHHLAAILYHQMYPKSAPASPPPSPPPPLPPPQERVRSHGAYATLHIADDAPLEVAEAAYRALSRSAHPDTGSAHSGHAWMVTLNLAIEQIRAMQAKERHGNNQP